MNLRTDIYQDIHHEAFENEKLEILQNNNIEELCICGKKLEDGEMFCSEYCKVDFDYLN